MREIKFRAWDKKDKKLKHVSELHFMPEDERDIFAVELFYDDEYKTGGRFRAHYGRMFSDVEVTQFTGLKDKNGKEIYEGDITKDAAGTMLIRFIDGAFVGESQKAKRNGHSPWRVATIADKVEIIGNIYENPELLK